MNTTLRLLARIAEVSFIPRAYTLLELARTLRANPGCILTRSLRLEGWQRTTVRILAGGRKLSRTLWYSPGTAPPPRRPRGRPSYALIATRLLDTAAD